MLYMFCIYLLFEAELTNLFTENVTFFTLYILCAQFKRFCKWRQVQKWLSCEGKFSDIDISFELWKKVVWKIMNACNIFVNDRYVLLASMNLYCFVRYMYLLRNLKDVYIGNKYIVVFRLKKNYFRNLFHYFLCVQIPPSVSTIKLSGRTQSFVGLHS
jgi:hypothetical protein